MTSLMVARATLALRLKSKLWENLRRYLQVGLWFVIYLLAAFRRVQDYVLEEGTI
jgi:hypothetical protein